MFSDLSRPPRHRRILEGCNGRVGVDFLFPLRHPDPMNGLPPILATTFSDGSCQQLILSDPRPGTEWKRATVRPIEIRGQSHFQFAFRTATQETHENLLPPAATARLTEILGPTFRRAHLQTTQADHRFRLRGERWKHSRSRPSRPAASHTANHDRKKRHLLPEGESVDFLVSSGIMTPDGKVRSAKQKKFRQINRFLELIDDVIHDLPSGPLHIVDFGCGKSYLTFALHHLLTVLRGRAVSIIGLDRRADVIESCRKLTAQLGLKDLSFHQQQISEHQPTGPVHLAVSLHACDTATDDALTQAVRWGANAILAVPCCQHELLTRLPSDALPGLLEYGLLKERFATLPTDALRAKALEANGYRTQVVEFIDLEHTAKNVLLRAVRHPDEAARRRAAQEYHTLKADLGLTDLRTDLLFQSSLAGDRTS